MSAIARTPPDLFTDQESARNKRTHAGDGEEFQPFLKAVGRGEKLKRDLDYNEAREAMTLILEGTATHAQVGAFLIAQRVKGESGEEIRGLLDAARDSFAHAPRPRVGDLLDLATPYDGKKKTAQLAPAVAIVLAAAGVAVLLHGGEKVPTKAGVTPGAVLAALDIPLPRDAGAVSRMVEAVGLGYADMRDFAPAWQRLLPLRRQFGLRTVLNTVEKLFNPAGAPYQLSGVFHANYTDRLRPALTGRRGSWIVQGEEGSIEMAAGRRTPLVARTPRDDLVVEPERLGFGRRERLTPRPTARAHAALTVSALSGQDASAARQVALTAGTILHLLGAAADGQEGFERANKIMAGGAAEERLALARRYQ